MSEEEAIRQFIRNTGADPYMLMTGLGYSTNGSALNAEGQKLLYGSAFTYGGSDTSYESIMQQGPESPFSPNLLIKRTGFTSQVSVGGETGFVNGAPDLNPYHMALNNTSFTRGEVTSTDNNQNNDKSNASNKTSDKYTFKTTTEQSGKKTNQYFIDGKVTTYAEWIKNAPADVISNSKKALA